ncbi:MAG: NAD-dependent epimerase/dehydratase family protein [Clostridiales bacterium]|jgi:UDP-glucose 4-epimerase|nr:NAD-dependent epimerase/dehydratase family protein [Clostridiales bacterium]
MERILITGKNSYIGSRFEEWLAKYPNKYEVDAISLRDESWKEKDFSEYDVVYHVAGIAHRKETKKNRKLYYAVNRDLAYEVAKKSKQDGIKQFIFLSTMSVYGLEIGVIDEHTPLKPKSNYGKSKLQAEELIKSLEDDSFKIAILRPPMVYGKGCKGNYPRLANLAKTTPIFPDIDNQRSMIYVDNLNEFVRLLIDDSVSGLFFPQNKEYVKTSEMVKLIAEFHGKKIKFTRFFNLLLKLINIDIVNKVFGDLIYEKDISEYKKNYNIYDFIDSISLTEKETIN